MEIGRASVRKQRLPFVAGILALIPVLVSGAASANAGSGSAPRQASDGSPPKNCVRVNSRFGYYGNPWCTPDEQLRWDRWEAKRLRAGR